MPKTDITVRELVDLVKRGELMLPEMQRRYVWPATRVRNLLDSLYRGYPSGTILVWNTNEAVEMRGLAVEAEQTTTGQKRLLLDGQQRITSLAATLSGEPVHVRSKGRGRTINILFNLEHPDGPPVETMDLEDEDLTVDIEDIEDEVSAKRDIQEEFKKRAFVVESSALKTNPLWVPVSEIFKQSDGHLLSPLGINSDNPLWEKYSNRLQKVRRIKEYQYVMQSLDEDMSYEEVTEIFVRVNTLGIKLRGSDLALAQISSRWKGFMNLVEDLAKQFGDDEDYVFESALSVRLMVALATKQSRFKTVGKLRKETLEESWEKATRGLQFAINFLRGNAEVDNLKYLSSPFLIIPIAVYAVLNDEQLSPEDERKLLKWFYTAHMRGHYSMGSSESILDADLSILFKSGSLDDLINQLRLHVKKSGVDVDDIANKGIRSPFFSMLYFVFRKSEAKDWFTGLRLSERHNGVSHLIQYHHIFPKSLLYEAKYEKKDVNEMANMAFIGGKTNRIILNKQPEVYFESEVIAKRGEDALSSQLITLDRSLWKIEKFPEFLAWRRQAIADAINRFMSEI